MYNVRPGLSEASDKLARGSDLGTDRARYEVCYHKAVPYTPFLFVTGTPLRAMGSTIPVVEVGLRAKQ